MSRARDIKALKAAAWYTVSSFISKAVLYLCTPIYTRLLTTLEYGQYSNFLSWQSILTAIITLDLSASINTAYLDYKKEKKFNEFVSTISLFSLLIPLLICIIGLPFIDYMAVLFDMNRFQILILMSFLCFANTIGIFQTEQNVRMKYKLSSALTLISTCGGVILTLIFVFAFDNKLNAILIGSVILNELISLVLLGRILLRSKKINREYLKYALRIAVPLIPHVLASTILGSSDKIMITKICGSEKTAFYSLIYTISMLITMFASSANRAWVPWFFQRLQEKEYSSIKKATAFILPVGSLGAVGLCLLAPEIVLIVGGMKYREAMFLMPPLVLHSVVNYYNTLYINIEFYTKKTFGISVATAFSSLLNVTLNYALITQFGFQAAAYTTLFSAILSLAFHLYKVRCQNMQMVFDTKRNLTLLAATSVICLSTSLLYGNFILRRLVIVVLIALCVFYVWHKRQMILELLKNRKM